MIGGNPVVVQQGGGSKVYSITDNAGLGFPASAEAGDYVVAANSVTSTSGYCIRDSNSNVVPLGTTTTGLARAIVTRYYIYFVMPASDVEVGNESSQ